VKIEEPEAGPMSGPMSSPGPMSGPMSDEPKNPTNSTLSLCPYVSLCDSENESGIGESVIPPDKQGGTDRDGRDIPELMSNPNGLARPYVRPYVSPTKGTLPPHRDTLKGPGLDEADLDPDSY